MLLKQYILIFFDQQRQNISWKNFDTLQPI